jgi:hypothetical protein
LPSNHGTVRTGAAGRPWAITEPQFLATGSHH